MIWQRLPILLLPALLSQGQAAEVRFNRDIQPILARNCFACHGPDKHERKAKLRLDTADGFLRGGSSKEPMTVKGKPGESLLWERIVSSDPDEIMPPPDSHKELNPREKNLIREWIKQGARYEGHWAFITPSLPAVPEGTEGNPIDRFIAAELASEGLSFSPEAHRRTLARRLYLDLTGLPPSGHQIKEFLSNEQSDAYEKLVAQLLNSSHFGEQLALPWMDAARYADTNGYSIDGGRDAWLWRDWVIKAFNDNMPYDQFLIEQLAGDLLPEATPKQRLATAFHRQTLTNTEGGTDQEQWRVAAVMDRLETTGSVWLGLTLTCARCHDHKYDNITQDEYYQLFAFYNNGDETTFSLPSSKAALAKYEKAKADHDKQVAELDKKLKQLLIV